MLDAIWKVRVTGELANALEDDVRARMFQCAANGDPFALATIIAADGGPRPVGSQMVITDKNAWGFLSGGCIEADVAIHGREVLASGLPQHLVYGHGSPFVDMRLPCGGRLDLLVERLDPADPALLVLQDCTEKRIPAAWNSSGDRRSCRPIGHHGEDLPDAIIRRHFQPYQRLIVVGGDPFGLAMATLGLSLGWEVTLLAPVIPAEARQSGIACDTRPIATALSEPGPDQWTAIAVATHELTVDEAALVPALSSEAGYVGVLGSRRKLPERIASLRRAGVAEDRIARLNAPIGLPIRAQSPWEVAVAVVAQVIDKANEVRPLTDGMD